MAGQSKWKNCPAIIDYVRTMRNCIFFVFFCNYFGVFISVGGVEIAIQESLEMIPDERNLVRSIFFKNPLFSALNPFYRSKEYADYEFPIGSFFLDFYRYMCVYIYI